MTIYGIEKRDATFTLFRQVRNGAYLGRDGDKRKSRLTQAVAGVPKFLVTNVAEMLLRGHDSYWGATADDLKGIRTRPSFRRQWMEAGVSPEVVTKSGHPPRPPDYRVGGLVERCPSTLFPRIRDALKVRRSSRQNEFTLDEFFGMSDEAVSIYLFEGWREEGQHRALFKAAVLCGLDEEGRPVGDGGSWIVTLSSLGSELDEQERLVEEVDAIRTGAMFLYAFGLMHCANAAVRERSYTPSPMKRQVEKIPLDDVPIRYHIVTVEVSGGDDDPDSDRRGPSGRKPLHICRGHFRTYTEEAPLFGRLTGTFWIPAHTRGSPTEGVVLKDYDEKPKANDA